MRLGQSLAAMNQKEAACATLAEVGRKFPRASAGVKRAGSRRNRSVRTAEAKAVSASEVTSLFSGLQSLPVLVLAVSGGPDSTASMVLAAQWRDLLEIKLKLVAVTVDHGLREESKAEAAAVARLAHKLDIAHRTSRWTGRKPKTGLQEAARLTRYRLLGNAARKAGADTYSYGAHARRPGRDRSHPHEPRQRSLRPRGDAKDLRRAAARRAFCSFVRSSEIAKARLIATLHAAGISYADDPSNRDPRFTRARLRGLMHLLARGGSRCRAVGAARAPAQAGGCRDRAGRRSRRRGTVRRIACCTCDCD